jgi:dTDP-4-dehydrorhamnose reductase
VNNVVLVTGAGGLLGSRLVRLLVEKGYNVVAVYRSHEPPRLPGIKLFQLDITNWVRLEDLVLKTQPATIVHAAAYTDVDGCEVNREGAWRANVEATRSIIRVARVVNSHIVYVSTDYVFDGERGMYRETDIPSPINYYGLTKLVAEELVRSSDLLYTVVRTSAIYGRGGSKKSFAEYVVEKLRRGELVKALVDQYVSPTHAGLLAEAIAEIVEAKPLGILHVAGPRMSRYDFAVRVAEAIGLDKSLIEKATMEEMAGGWIARRPRDSSLDTSKARELLATPFWSLEEALKRLQEELGTG